MSPAETVQVPVDRGREPEAVEHRRVEEVREVATVCSAPSVIDVKDEERDQDGNLVRAFVSREGGARPTRVTRRGVDELADVKAGAALRWVAAVNADGQFGQWRYEVVRAIPQVRQLLDRHN